MYRTRKSLSSTAILARRLPIWQSHGHLKSFSERTATKESTKDLKRGSPMPFRDIPGPTLFETLRKYGRDGWRNHHLIVQDSFEKYGPTFKLQIPGNTMVCTCDPNNIENVFRAEGYPASRGADFLLGLNSYFVQEKGLKKGIIGNDESWHLHRSAVASKVLRPVALKPFVSDLCGASDDTIASFKEGVNLDVLPDLMKWSTENIGVVLFRHRIGVNAETPNKMNLDFINAVCNFLTYEAKLYFTIPFYKYFKTPTLKRLYSCFDQMWYVTDYYVQKVKEQRIPSAKGSVVQQLFDDGKLSEDEIMQIILNMFAGGVDTTANSLVNLLYLLSEFPNAQKKLHEDIQQTLPNGETPTYDHITKIPYLKAVIKEASRLHPTVSGTVRQLKETIILSGYEVPPQTVIGLEFFLSSSMRKTIFGEDFENFNPERWLCASKKIHPFAWTRFGFGPRMCLGKRIAELEVGLFLIRLLQKYEIEARRHDEEKMEWMFELTLNPTKPFNLNLKMRK